MAKSDRVLWGKITSRLIAGKVREFRSTRDGVSLGNWENKEILTIPNWWFNQQKKWFKKQKVLQWFRQPISSWNWPSKTSIEISPGKIQGRLVISWSMVTCATSYPWLRKAIPADGVMIPQPVKNIRTKIISTRSLSGQKSNYCSLILWDYT